jgi:cytidine deaminase
MSPIKPQLQASLANFPQQIRNWLLVAVTTDGRLEADLLDGVLAESKLGIETLMLSLLCLAKCVACAPISGVHIGAVALVVNGGRRELFLGANREFTGICLNQTIHAEQAAVINAWNKGATQILCLAVSAPPCGHCRQFLMEISPDGALDILLPVQRDPGYEVVKLAALLPRAFGPFELDQISNLMTNRQDSRGIVLETISQDPQVLKALAAAQRAFAPYSGNMAGCCLVTPDGRSFTGSSTENAAFNPGLTALQTAISGLAFRQPQARWELSRAILVELPGGASQKSSSEILLSTLSPKTRLEYHRAARNH